MKTADILEATISSWGLDEALGRPLSDFVAAVLADPPLLIRLAGCFDQPEKCGWPRTS